MHAAVGLAQIRKLNQFLTIQKNHQLLKDILSKVPEIRFRNIPDPTGDSCTFLSWFLPTEAQTKAVIATKAQYIVAGNFYWYDNNWHYIKKWNHLKNISTLNHLNDTQQQALNKLAQQDFSASDAVMSKCVSTAISLSWTEKQIVEKGEKMVEIMSE